jgi:hypothetical protein
VTVFFAAMMLSRSRHAAVPPFLWAENCWNGGTETSEPVGINLPDSSFFAEKSVYKRESMFVVFSADDQQ